MPAERFYLPSPLKKGDTVSLTGPELHHLAHVMRIRLGKSVELVNGQNELAEAILLTLSKHSATLEITHSTHSPASPSGITLVIPCLRMQKLELVIEKGTELGADAFWIYPADFSEKETLSDHQKERLTHISISAMKQCGRLDLPELQYLPLSEILASPLPHFFGDTRPTAKPISFPKKPLIFITGPEKGFSPKELQLLDSKGTGVRLHRYILRAETAPLVALTLLMDYK